jgi:hypothetical protein
MLHGIDHLEKMWSKIRAILRSLKARTEEGLCEALAKASNSVTASDAIAIGWFEFCGYLYAQT